MKILEVSCPDCTAPANSRCIRLDGGVRVSFHRARLDVVGITTAPFRRYSERLNKSLVDAPGAPCHYCGAAGGEHCHRSAGQVRVRAHKGR